MSARRWSIGLVTGAVVGVGSILAGSIAGVLGLIAIVLAMAETPRAPAVGGVLVGIGGAWLALLGRAGLTCRQDCAGPDLIPWVVAATAFLLLGLVVSIRERRASSS